MGATTEYEGEIFTHEYYLCGRMPVVILVDNDGDWRGSKAPDKETGQLKYSTHMDYIEKGGQTDIEKITEEKFKEACQKYF